MNDRWISKDRSILRDVVGRYIELNHQREEKVLEREEFVVKCRDNDSYFVDRHIDEYFADQPEGEETSEM